MNGTEETYKPQLGDRVSFFLAVLGEKEGVVTRTNVHADGWHHVTSDRGVTYQVHEMMMHKVSSISSRDRSLAMLQELRQRWIEIGGLIHEITKETLR